MRKHVHFVKNQNTCTGRGVWWGGGGGGTGTFPIEYFQGLSFLHLEITLLFATLYYAFEEKLFFLPP